MLKQSFSKIHLVLLLVPFVINLKTYAQTPSFYNNNNATATNAFPLNSTASNKVQWIYGPGVFNSAGTTGVPAGRGLITKIYYKMSSTVSTTASYTNFTISLGQNIGTASSYGTATASGVSFNTGLTTCFYQASSYSMTSVVAGGWYGVTLQTPFLYDPALGLILEIKVSAGTGNGIANIATTGNMQRLYAAYAATTGTTNTGSANIGFDLIPATTGYNNASVSAFIAPLNFCSGTQDVKVRIKNEGRNVINNLTVQWRLDTVMQTPLTWTSPLDTFGGTTYRNDTVVTLGSVLFSSSKALRAWTANPNSVADTVNTNDTINVVIAPALSGTYTIGGVSPSFATISDAISALNLYGICGPVTFNVAAGSGPYTNNLSFISIAGASAINTITFNGNGNTITSATNPVIDFAGSGYITLDSFNIVNTGATGFGVHIGGQSHHLTLNRNRIEVSTTATATTSGGLIVAGSLTAPTTAGNNAQYLTITNNEVIGGYYNFTLMGNTGSLDNYGHYIANNTFRDFYVYGCYLGNADTVTFINNNINRATRTTVSTLYGIYLNTSRNMRIQKNRLHDFGIDAYTAYPIYIVNCVNAAGYETEVSNNMIYNVGTTATLYAIYSVTTAITGFNFYHNTIQYEVPSASTSAIRGAYFSVAITNVNFKNNVISITGGGTGVKTGIYVTTTSASFISNNNVIYVNTGTTDNVGYWGAAAVSLVDWQTASSLDALSSNLNPQFTNTAGGNLKPLSVPIDNMGAAVGITTDILGLARPVSAPDAGAYEFTTAIPCTGAQHAGNATTSRTYACSAQSFNLSLANDSSSLGLRYQWQISTAGAAGPFSNMLSDTLKNITKTQTATGWYRNIVSCPASSAFDTSTVVRVRTTTTPFAGTYTINPALPLSATNYQNFTDLADEINCVGVTAPVIFNVTPDTVPYAGNFFFTNFPGVSATNTVTFNGNGSQIMSDQTPVVGFSGASYITLDSFNIKGAPSYAGIGVNIGGASHHLTLNRNIIDMGMTATASTCAGIAVSGSISVATTAGNNAQYLNITNNEVIGGYYNVTIIGNASYANNYGHVITGNTFRDFYVYGLYMVNADTVLVSNNNINRATRPAVSTFYGLYGSSIRNIKYRNNRIHDAGTGTYTAYPVYVTTSVNSTGYETEFTNNITYNIGTTGTIYGYYLLGTRNGMKFYHNTVNLDLASSTGTIRGVFMSTAPDNHDFRNNIISVTGTGTGTKHLIYVTTGSATITSNRNVLYIDTALSTNFTGYITADQKSIFAWQTASGVDANSVPYNPVFTSPATGNLSPLSINCDNLGTNVGITTDITGTTRSASTPDAGAYEFTGVAGDIAVTAGELKRSGVCYSTHDTARITIRNMIGTTIDFSVDPLRVTWMVTGPLNTTDSLLINSGTLAPGASTSAYTSNINMSMQGNYTLNGYISPNAVNVSRLNDTLTLPGQLLVGPLLTVTPRTTTVNGPNDTVMLTANSPLFPGGGFFISEICHFKTTTGAPVGGWPSYHLADDYIEITGIPNSDLAGYILEQWNTTTMLSTYTFPAGTILSPSGTAIIAVGTVGASVNSSTNFYYLGNGSYAGTFDSGTTPTGRILKNSSGTIIDAAGYSGSSTYTFPAAAGVTATDWTGNNPVSTTTCGIRLTGPDMNNPTNWIVSSAVSPQDPNILNSGLTAPTSTSVTGFQWSYLGTPIDTLPRIKVGPYTVPGVYAYVATFTNACGTFRDTAYVTASSTVPVKMLSFDAHRINKDVSLFWQTASEINNDHFTLQRSTNGKQFENIGEIKGRGHSDDLNAYTYTDYNAFEATHARILYYRLTQVDLNGKQETGNAVEVMNDQTSVVISSIFPNPNKGAFDVTINSAIGYQSQLKIVNALGTEVWGNRPTLLKGDNDIHVDLQLSPGIYILVIQQDDMTTVTKHFIVSE